MKTAAFFLLGVFIAAPDRFDDGVLRAALAGYERSNTELRAASASLRDQCIGPRVQPVPFKETT